MNNESKIIVFQNQEIRQVLHNNEWYFSVIDVVSTLSGSSNARRYWSDLKRQLQETEGFFELYEKIVQLKLPSSADGKRYLTDCANTETLFRIIQSIPSPKAEPFKRWLAKVGYERVQEIEDPEIASKRARAIYQAKGYSDSWIEKRMRGIQVREELTEEWKQRNVGAEQEYAILTAEISKATFGMTPTEYRTFKSLKQPTENLRDHMTDLELIFTMLGEASTTEIARKKDAQGFVNNKKAAREGGSIAGNARRALEKKTSTKISTKENFKYLTENKRETLSEEK
ncbi:BRO family protein [soil metagenome]